MGMLWLTDHMHAYTIPKHNHLIDSMTFEEKHARGDNNAIWPTGSLFEAAAV